jgi:DHA3 family macrolide efflux protein-like MFS transporter
MIGPGRGCALLYIVVGLANVIVYSISFAYSPLRRIELDIPDAIVVEKKDKQQ